VICRPEAELRDEPIHIVSDDFSGSRPTGKKWEVKVFLRFVLTSRHASLPARNASENYIGAFSSAMVRTSD